MKSSLEERQKHLDLNEECIILIKKHRSNSNGSGSNGTRLVLAHFLKTTLPEGFSIHCCHACNNDCCSNPKHLYWGTPRENIQDQISANTHITQHQNGGENSYAKAIITPYGRFGSISEFLGKHSDKIPGKDKYFYINKQLSSNSSWSIL